MSFQYDGQKCPICHAYLFEEDDIACCPECGAPHHRDCYLSVGHCGLQEFHGTERQYQPYSAADTEAEQPHKEKTHTAEGTAKCQMCGEEFEISARACPRCGAPNFKRMNHYVEFDFLGGVPAEMDLGNGVTADDAKRFVMANTTRYIPKFAEMKNGKKTSWNWLAFLFPCGWFCSRKMYLKGILAGIMQLAFLLLIQPYAKLLSETGSQNPYDLQLVEQLLKQHLAVAVFAIVGVFLLLLFQVLTGLFGDYLYYRHVLGRIGQIKEESEDEDEDFRRFGGVNIFGMLLGILAINYLPGIIFSLIP